MCLNLTYWLCDLLPRNRHCWIHLHSQKNKWIKKKISKVCTLRAPARPKGTFKENHKIKWASIESSWSKVDKTRTRNIALFGSGIRWVQQMGRLVVWWGANVLKRSAFKSQLKDVCFCRRRPDLAAEVREKQHGSTVMFSWKFLIAGSASKWIILSSFSCKQEELNKTEIQKKLCKRAPCWEQILLPKCPLTWAVSRGNKPFHNILPVSAAHDLARAQHVYN